MEMEILELTIRTLCDVRAKNVADGAYLYSQTKDNQHSVLSAAQQVINERLAEKVLIAKSDPKSGYPGNFDWEKELIQRGIQKYKILVTFKSVGLEKNLEKNHGLLHSLYGHI
jgi:hypothetical protein